MPRRRLNALLLLLLGLLVVQGVCGAAVAAPVDGVATHATQGGDGMAHCCVSPHAAHQPGVAASGPELDDDRPAPGALALPHWLRSPGAVQQAFLAPVPSKPDRAPVPAYVTTGRLRL